MMTEILIDELYRAGKMAEKKLNNAPYNFSEYYIHTAKDAFTSFIEKALSNSNLSAHTIATPQDLKAESAKLIYFINCRDSKYTEDANRENLITDLTEYLEFIKDNPKYFLILPIIIDPPIALPHEVRALAEREYDYYLAQKDLTAAESLYLRIDQICREHTQKGANVILLRFTGIYGPGIELFPEISFENVIKNAYSEQLVVINDDDQRHYHAPCYVLDAFSAILGAIISNKAGNVFHAAPVPFSIKDFKLAIQRALGQEIGLNATLSANTQPIYHCLSSLKISKYTAFDLTNFDEIAYRLSAHYLQKEYNMERNLTVFDGKLNQLKELQMYLLKTVDNICREHHIQYFLAGGSLLGAIRHHSIIPWDDDLDIAMLRNDFEKFRKVCPQNLGDEFTYESHSMDRNNHYYFDKIRIKDTFLKTHFSDNFKINNGIFLDIVCYDQTGNNRRLTKMQIKTITTVIRFINMKWYKQPRSKGHAKTAKFLYPIIRLLPFSFLHWIFERAIRFYQNKKNAKYLIDGMGLNIRKGRFSKEWVDKIEYTDFAGFKAPIPKGYHEYLEHLYGKNYMTLPPISNRCSHSLVRIDLGHYLFKNETKTIQNINLNGELYESGS